MLIDKFRRKITYLRVSITDKCNLRCIYCRKDEDDIEYIKREEILSYEELLYIIKVFVNLGVKKVRITGGEPLVRRGVEDFLLSLSDIEGLKEIAITTNGVLLGEKLFSLKRAGIKRINISLDTLDRNKFIFITKRDALEKVISGIKEAKENGFIVKLNMVVIKGINDDEIERILEFAIRVGVSLRYIELMPTDFVSREDYERMFMSVDEIKSRVRYIIGKEVSKDDVSGPATEYVVGDGVRVGFIPAMSCNFCSSCNRLRLSSDGKLYPCLMSDRFVDLREVVREGYNDDKLIERIKEGLAIKPERHTFSDVIYKMSAIGG